MGDVIELAAREKTYPGREVAELLGIGASTLRKWSMLLEQHGYWFLRDSQNRRVYRQMDIAVFHRFSRLTRDQLYPQEEAAQIIASHPMPEAMRMEPAPALAPRMQPSYGEWEEKLHALAAKVQKQEDAHHALLEKVERQEAYIRSSLKERDRRLTKAMNDILDAKVQLSRMKDQQRKTSIWQKLFPLR